ncbi:MAG: hypothetical protein C0602_00380 [Denitrovibrio sp.]|nr:MAG: hypothetical protein C0602_00380 [Denitrovibrio sp.]
MRMKFACLKTITLILTSFLFASIAYADMQVLFPTSNDVKAVSDIHVICISKDESPAVISINGVDTEKKLICTDPEKKEGEHYMLMSILKLHDGENNITITQGGVQETFKITKVESPVGIVDWTDNLSNFHSGERNELCKSCHKFENLADCVNCHRDKFAGEWVHKPVKEAKCFACHEKDKNFIPQEPFAVTCLNCHENTNKAMQNAAYTHGPVAAGFCTICHSPHKATEQTHLRRPSNDLCADCHVSAEQGFNFHSRSYIQFHPVDKVYVEKLGKELECSDCHNPHYADNAMFIKTEDEEALCVLCHEKGETGKLLKALSEKFNSN